MRASASSNYGWLERTSHRLALGNRAVAHTMFDIDHAMARRKPGAASDAAVAQGRHVFVAGLARAGTTVLLRRLHASGSFRCLTYRDMPFVMAPFLWRRLSARRQAPAAAATERAHGDGINVNADSPESFEEVFWRVFDGSAFIGRDRIMPHKPDAEDLGAYVSYVAAILASEAEEAPEPEPEPTLRYLSKNNNNTLRLPALRRAFPNGLIVVPFRHPLAQSASLWRQHQRFLALQEADPFVLTYMNWLGHFEFGQGHKPFMTGRDAALDTRSPSGIDYWLATWLRVHRFVLQSAPPDAHFVCHEALCVDPAVWDGLAAAAAVPRDIGEPFVDQGAPAAPTPGVALVREAEALYDALVARAEAVLPRPVHA